MIRDEFVDERRERGEAGYEAVAPEEPAVSGHTGKKTADAFRTRETALRRDELNGLAAIFD